MWQTSADDLEFCSQPISKKKLKVDASFCEFGCGRKKYETNNNNNNICCKTCKQMHEQNAYRDYDDIRHDNDCDKREHEGYSFKLIAFKQRIHTLHEENNGVTSTKYICIINNNIYNEQYYYRIWKGENYNNYVLIHPLKLVTDEQSMNNYINTFDYIKYNTSSDDTECHKFNAILTGRNKAKIVESIKKLSLSSSLTQFIKDMNEDIDDNQYAEFDIHIDGKNILSGVHDHSLRRCNHNAITYISEVLYYEFPFSDIETTPSCNLSNCSGDTHFGINYNIMNNKLIPWLKQQCNGDDDDLFDQKYLERLEITSRYIWYDKLQKVLQNDTIRGIFDKLYIEIEWNNNAKRKEYYDVICESLNECIDEIINIILSMIAPRLTQNDLEQRRLEMWTENAKYCKNLCIQYPQK